MEDQLEEFRQDQLEKYLDETSTEDISADDLITWFQNNQPNTNRTTNQTTTNRTTKQSDNQPNNQPITNQSMAHGLLTIAT